MSIFVNDRLNNKYLRIMNMDESTFIGYLQNLPESNETSEMIKYFKNQIYTINTRSKNS